MSTKITTMPDELISSAKHFNNIINHIFTQLQELADEVINIWQTMESLQKKPSSRELNMLRPSIDKRLLSNAFYLCGVGIILEPYEIADEGMFLAWQKLEDQHKVVPLLLNFNKRSESYYNYLNMPWFISPKENKQNFISGPYVDIYGADMYILTFAHPIFIKDRFIGIAGADVPIKKIERLLLNQLIKLHHEAAIITDKGRIIASNTINWTVGEIVKENNLSDDIQCVKLDNNSHISNSWLLISNLKEQPLLTNSIKAI